MWRIQTIEKELPITYHAHLMNYLMLDKGRSVVNGERERKDLACARSGGARNVINEYMIISISFREALDYSNNLYTLALSSQHASHLIDER